MYEPTDTVQTDAILLFRRLPRVDFDAVCADLNTALGLADDLQLSIGDARDKDFALLSCAAFHVLVTVHHRPYARKNMAQALGSHFVQENPTDFERAIRVHRKHVVLHVGSGPDYLGDGIGELLAAQGKAPLAVEKPIGFRACVLRVAVQGLSSLGPEAVHWRQSDMLLGPDDLGAVSGTDIPVLQAIHPQLLTDPDAPDLCGVIAARSEHFIGRTIQVDPAARPVSASARMALSMVIERDAGRLDLAHGDIIETTRGEVLHIRHAPPCADWPSGRICLGEAVSDPALDQDTPADDAPDADPAPVKAPARRALRAAAIACAAGLGAALLWSQGGAEQALAALLPGPD